MGHTLSDAYADQEVQDPDAETLGEAAPDPNALASDDTLAAQAATPITPELKAQIAGEVQNQLAIEGAQAAGTAQPTAGEFPDSLKPNRVFVVANLLDVSTPDQQACSLTPGDVLRMEAAPPAASGTADVRVASSHRQDCPTGVMVTVSLPDLQEMQNSLRAQLDAGLGDLRSNQGKGGLPSAPPASLEPGQTTTVGAPDPDPNVVPLLVAQDSEASRTENAAVQSAFPQK
jgi:hypothetical protein